VVEGHRNAIKKIDSHPEWVQGSGRSGTTSVVQINQPLVTGGLRAQSDLRLLSRQPSGLQMTHLICLRYTLIRMDATELISEIIATYQRHGWELRRVLLRPETRTALAAEPFGQAAICESDFDALWFARSSRAGREAWELRLIAELRYALFEAFEADESEADREEVRLEMENRMREHTK